MRRFYNYTASVYTFQDEMVRGSKVRKKVLKYNNIKIAFWGNSRSLNNTSLANETDQNNYEINFMPWFPVDIGDFVEIEGRTFKVQQVIKHHRHNGVLDNYQVLISVTTETDEQL